MEKPNFRITQDNFSEIQGSGLWLRNDIPLTRLEECGGHFSKNPDTFALFASGCLPSPISDNGLQAIGGIDWVKIEPNPKNGEPDLNAYHYVIGKPDSTGYPVYGVCTGK